MPARARFARPASAFQASRESYHGVWSCGKAAAPFCLPAAPCPPPLESTPARVCPPQELEATEHQFTCQPSEEGVETLAQLQQAVFGAGSQGQSFTQCVYLASLAQVRGCTAAVGEPASQPAPAAVFECLVS